jgi:hypothetical protein
MPWLTFSEKLAISAGRGRLFSRRPAHLLNPNKHLGLRFSPEQRRKLELERPQATYAFRSTTANLQRLESAVDDLLKQPGLRGITGIQSAVPNIPGSAAANAQSRLETLRESDRNKYASSNARRKQNRRCHRERDRQENGRGLKTRLRHLKNGRKLWTDARVFAANQSRLRPTAGRV